MNTGNKRKDILQDDNKPKRVKKECTFGERCYRRNPAHFREFSHRHLEAILDTYKGAGPYTIPDKYAMDQVAIEEQLDVIVQKQLYTPWIKEEGSSNLLLGRPNGDRNRGDASGSSSTLPSQTTRQENTPPSTKINSTSTQEYQRKPVLKGILKNSPGMDHQGAQNSSTTLGGQNSSTIQGGQNSSTAQRGQNVSTTKGGQILSTAQGTQSKSHAYPLFGKPTAERAKKEPPNKEVRNSSNREGSSHTSTDGQNSSRQNIPDYCPIVPPTRSPVGLLSVIPPKGQMASKHAASAPYHLFYTTITAAKETHRQPYSITFQEILDRSLGELKCSLQINFMVELGWLLAQYYFAGYSAKKLTILYGEDSPDLQTITQKKPNVDAHKVRMASPFGTHHTKMMILCYEDGSLRVVVSTANLYLDDWENRVQGLWFSPRCPELPPEAMPHAGDSSTQFKRTLLRYLNHYHEPALAHYIERVKRCDFSHINVFLVASVPGGHFDAEWGLTRVGALLREHCALPPADTKQWPLIAQASSLGSYGKDSSVWLTSDFLHNFSKIKQQPQMLGSLPPLKLIYPSLENVQRSHDGLLGGGCLPYGAAVHTKQPWLKSFLYQWRASCTRRDRAMPHIKSYTRVSPDSTRAAYFLLTSANCSKAAWGSINKGNAALRIMSYEAGVLFLPQFIIKEDLFPLEESVQNRLVLPYDVPPVKYTSDMSPWVSDYLRG